MSQLGATSLAFGSLIAGVIFACLLLHFTEIDGPPLDRPGCFDPLSALRGGTKHRQTHLMDDELD